MDRIVCAGDVANFGPRPNACITLLTERNIVSVQGNCDHDILLPPPDDHAIDKRTGQITEINNWCRERLTSASRRWLAALPPHLIPAPGVLIVHGGIETSDAIMEANASPVFPPGISVVAAGHLHVPFVNHTKQGVWVNAGSAGRPCDGDPRAAVAVLEQHAKGWKASIYRIPFDLDSAVQAIRKAQMPYTERLIETQRKACWW